MVYRVLCAHSRIAVDNLKLVGRPALVARIRDLIRRDGPITFDRFMDLALYEPGLGYYTSHAALPQGGPGTLADFQTSPQVHPIFGQLVARELVRIWEALGEPRPFLMLELGAGGGELARQILDGLADRMSGVDVVYHAVDVRRGVGIGELVWWPDLATMAASGRRVDVVVSNEFFDALPVHRLIRVGGELREVYVDWGGHGFVERFGDPSDPTLANLVRHRKGVTREGWRGEVCRRIDRVLETVAGAIDRGVVLTIDYGYEASDPRYPDGETLLAYYRHQWSNDVYLRVGEQDLTSHLDVDGFLRAGAQFGLAPARVTNQRDFLRRLGFDEDARQWAERESTPGRQWQSRFAMAELIDPRGLGRLKVVAQTKGDVSCTVARTVST